MVVVPGIGTPAANPATPGSNVRQTIAIPSAGNGRRRKGGLNMNTWINMSASNMAYLMAEDTGAPELRNPLNSALRANKEGRSAAHPLRALKAFVVALFAM